MTGVDIILMVKALYSSWIGIIASILAPPLGWAGWMIFKNKVLSEEKE